jgi:hypothetical protein
MMRRFPPVNNVCNEAERLHPVSDKDGGLSGIDPGARR